MASPEEQETLARLDSMIAEIPTSDHPYHASLAVKDVALDAIDTEIGGELYGMWSVLQDWYELREEDAREALEAMRKAASDWPAVKGDRTARTNYVEQWRSTVSAAFERPRQPPGPDSAVIGPSDGEVVDYDEKAGFGFIRADSGGPTYFFRWSEIQIDAFFKSVEIGARVHFDARIDHAGEHYALSVVPQG